MRRRRICAARTRLRFLDEQAFWEGRVNRADLMDRFGVSVPQATNDLSRYQELAPENLAYDKRAKAYLTTQTFVPVFRVTVMSGLRPPAVSFSAETLLVSGTSTGFMASIAASSKRSCCALCVRTTSFISSSPRSSLPAGPARRPVLPQVV